MFSIKLSRLFLTNLNNYTLPLTISGQTRNVKRWVGPTLRELKCRREKQKSPVYTPRNTFIEWNHNSEVIGFGKRLKENFDTKLLYTAFVHNSYIVQEELRQQKLGIENPNLNIEDNRKLIEIGEKIIADYVQSYLEYFLPKCPTIGITSIFNWLTSDEQLANISKHIGTSDIILCGGNSPDTQTLRDTFIAIVGALAESSGDESAYIFIRDFICTQLNQKDLTEIWEIKNPLKLLQEYCKEKSMEEPEPRIIGEIGKNTVLAVYNVGVYSNKKLIGKGFGESINIAIETAALDALRTFFGIRENMKPFNFEIQLEKTNNNSKIKQQAIK